MDPDREKAILQEAGALYSREALLLFRDLLTFVGQRFRAAGEAADRVADAPAERDEGAAVRLELHTMLSECWEALDGVGRLVNVCLHPRFPGSGLFPPDEITRQCTFYTVRRDLHRHPKASRHPLAELMWEQTRHSPHPAYERLSFLYNISRFLPVPLVGERELPGWEDLPERVRSLLRPQEVERRPLPAALEEIMRWEEAFLEACCDGITTEMQAQSSSRQKGD